MTMFAKRRRLTQSEEKDIDDAVVQLIFNDMRPFAVVDGDGFKNLVKRLNPDYGLKSCNVYRAKAVTVYTEAVRRLKEILGGARYKHNY